jgi:hypothetical protein
MVIGVGGEVFYGGGHGLLWGRLVCGDGGSKGEHGEAERRFGICGDGKRRIDD